MSADRLGIDLRHDERHRRVHAKCRGIVDDHRALLDGERRESLGDVAAGGEERDIDAAEAVLLELAHGQRLAAMGQCLARGARRSEQAQLREREAPVLETPDELDADGAGGADDRNHRRRAG
jgi:hypothetical protein